MRIALTGHKQVGKSECAKFCKLILGSGVTIDMIGHLRTGLMALVGSLGVKVPVEHFYENKTPESRRLLQAGGAYVRSLDKEALIKYACQYIDCAMSDVHFFIENMRMKNEEAAFVSRGFIVVRVIRPGYDGDSDVTETEMDSIEADYTIVNDGTLTQLRGKVSDILSELKARGE